MIQSDHKRNTRFESTPDPKTPYQKIIFRMNESFMSSLRNFLDSALYLSLTVQIATLVWTQRFDPAAYAGKIGDFIYDLVLLMYTLSLRYAPSLLLSTHHFYGRKFVEDTFGCFWRQHQRDTHSTSTSRQPVPTKNSHLRSTTRERNSDVCQSSWSQYYPLRLKRNFYIHHGQYVWLRLFSPFSLNGKEIILSPY